MDVTAVVAFLGTEVLAAINSVGTVILQLSGSAVGYKWIKAMIFS